MLRYKIETRPSSVALYDIRPGNGAGQFLQPRSPHGASLTEGNNWMRLVMVYRQSWSWTWLRRYWTFCFPSSVTWALTRRKLRTLLTLMLRSRLLWHYRFVYFHFNGHFSRCTRVSRHRNVSILDFIGAEDDGGGEWWQLELQDVQSSSQIVTTSKPTASFLQAGWPSCHPTNSVRTLEYCLKLEQWQFRNVNMHTSGLFTL